MEKRGERLVLELKSSAVPPIPKVHIRELERSNSRNIVFLFGWEMNYNKQASMESNRVTTASLLIIVVFIIGVVFKLAKPVLFPFFIAIFISFVLFPILDFFTRFKIPRSVTIIFILFVIFFILFLMGSLFYSSVETFTQEIDAYVVKINHFLNSIVEGLKTLPLPIDWESINEFEQLKLNAKDVGDFLLSTLGPFLSFVFNLFLILVFLVFILAGRGLTETKVHRSFKKVQAKKFIEIKNNIDSQVQRYLGIKTIVSFITGFLATIVLLIFGVDFAIVIGFFTFILNYIPNVGSIFATAFPILIAIFQFDTIWPAFWIFIILGAIQMVLGNFIEPRVMGYGLGLSPLVVIFCLVFWGWLWGLPGMILAVPIAAIIKIITANIPSTRFISVLISRD